MLHLSQTTSAPIATGQPFLVLISIPGTYASGRRLTTSSILTTYFVVTTISGNVMLIPDYAVLFVISTLLFIAVAASALLTHGLNSANLNIRDRQRLALRLILSALVWVGLMLAIANSNILVPRTEQTLPLLGILIIGSSVLGSALLIKSHSAKAMLDAVPLHWFAVIQIYRIVGAVFLMLERDGLLPAYFAISTGWGDIAIGLSAPIVGVLLWQDAGKFRLVGLAWCIAGMSDLLLVLFKAVNSAPGPLQSTAFDLPTVIIGYFPFSLIPLLVVPISLILHIQLVRRLWRVA